jgi:hypothetical protein
MSDYKASSVVFDPSKYLETRRFNREKLVLFNYIESMLNINIDDIILLENSLFILLDNEKLEKLQSLKELRRILKLKLGIVVFIIPLTKDVENMMYHVCDRDLVQNISCTWTQACIHVAIKLGEHDRHAFFKKFKPLLADIQVFLKILLMKEIKINIC